MARSSCAFGVSAWCGSRSRLRPRLWRLDFFPMGVHGDRVSDSSRAGTPIPTPSTRHAGCPKASPRSWSATAGVESRRTARRPPKCVPERIVTEAEGRERPEEGGRRRTRRSLRPQEGLSEGAGLPGLVRPLSLLSVKGYKRAEEAGVIVIDGAKAPGGLAGPLLTGHAKVLRITTVDRTQSNPIHQWFTTARGITPIPSAVSEVDQ